MSNVLQIGHSPDPDDAFMFCALSHGAVKIRDFEIDHVLEDIQSLNERAMNGDLEVTAISAHAFLSVADKYWIIGPSMKASTVTEAWMTTARGNSPSGTSCGSSAERAGPSKLAAEAITATRV